MCFEPAMRRLDLLGRAHVDELCIAVAHELGSAGGADLHSAAITDDVNDRRGLAVPG